ncbi:unnamed protein product [Cylindrotheca closterium]|uniref:Glycosyltransferase family 92 protein n=1 Tax=Cylindrotheca closterium TaxID=2856 RepID=A0AAD2CHV9_9STRA|nr:unnamed protein product [Cylindrotheca closterium]
MDDFMKYANFSAPFFGASMWQEAMQNQCLSQLRRYGVKWVLTLDVDEFVEIRGDESSRQEEEYPLRSFLAQYYDQDNNDGDDDDGNIQETKETNDNNKANEKANNKGQKVKPIGALRMRSVPFPTNRKFNLPTFRPPTAWPWIMYIGVHWCRRYSHGAISKSLNAFHEVMLHHIRAATGDEYWLEYKKSGGKGMVKDSTMAEQHRIQVCHDMIMIHGPFAAFVKHLDEAKCNDWPPPKSGMNE